MYDLIIIGSGPAGLGAAVYARRAALSVLVLEKMPMSGGQVLNTYEVDNYLGIPGVNGFDLGMRFREHAERMGARFVQAQVVGVTDGDGKKTVHTKGGDYEARAVILASGAVHRRLEVRGEAELAGRGVSYCATCDGAFYRGKVTVVVGGGDVAAEDAIFLARGCEKVYVVHRREQLRAARILQERLFALQNVEMVWNSTVERIEGQEKVTGVLVRDKGGQERVLKADGIFIAVGIVPETAAFTGLASMDEDGYLIAGEDCATDAPGIFAAGDIRKKKLRQIITAAADGANAAVAAEGYLMRRGLLAGEKHHLADEKDEK